MMVNINKTTWLASIFSIAAFHATAGEDHHHPHEQHKDHAGDAHDEHDHSADDHAQHNHDAHVHGAWELFIALDDNRLSVTASGPVIDLLGFENVPSGKEQRAAVNDTTNTLKTPEIVLALEARAGCKSTAPGVVRWPASFSKKEDENAHHHDKSHKHDDGHDAHSHDVEITYLFECNRPARLRNIKLSLFDSYPAINTIEAVFLSDAHSNAQRLTKKQPSLTIE